MLGSELVSKVLCEGLTIWDRSTVMPHMDGITNYYDCKKGLTTSSWENQAATENNAVLVNGTIAQDGALQVLCTRSSYGYFDAGFYDRASDVTLYAVFDGETKGNIGVRRAAVGGSFGSPGGRSTGKWIVAGIDNSGSNADRIQARFNNITIQSDVSCTAYHVAVVVKKWYQSNGEHRSRLYIDGELIDETEGYNCVSGNKFAIGGIRGSESPYNTIWPDVENPGAIRLKMVAVGNAAHTDVQVTQNSAWLRTYYRL